MTNEHSESTVITLADWYHAAAVNVPLPALADSTLINGLGRYTNGTASPLAVITVQKGKRYERTLIKWRTCTDGSPRSYRFRLLNIACDPNYIFSIDGHNMTVIEVDGVTQPAPAPRFSRTPAEVKRPPPAAQNANDNVLVDWGFAADDVHELRSAGVLK